MARSVYITWLCFLFSSCLQPLLGRVGQGTGGWEGLRKCLFLKHLLREGLSISHEIKWVLTRLEVQFIFRTEKCSTHALVVFCLGVKHGLHMTDYVGARVREWVRERIILTQIVNFHWWRSLSSKAYPQKDLLSQVVYDVSMTFFRVITTPNVSSVRRGGFPAWGSPCPVSEDIPLTHPGYPILSVEVKGSGSSDWVLSSINRVFDTLSHSYSTVPTACTTPSVDVMTF